MDSEQKKVKPMVEVEMLEMDDPEFQGGSTHTARALLTNPTTVNFDFVLELYLGVTKVATSGLGTVVIAAGASEYVDFTIVMPSVEGTHHVYLDVTVDGELIKHYLATEDITIIVSPDIDIGPIIWA